MLVQVVISLASLLGIDSRSGYLDGYGAINPSVIRDLIESTDVTMTRLLCDPVAGSVMVADPTRYTPTAGLKHATGFRDRHCRLPVCTARVRHLDHIQARVDAGLTTEQNLQGLCERSHLAKHHPSWHVHGDATSIDNLAPPHAAGISAIGHGRQGEHTDALRGRTPCRGAAGAVVGDMRRSPPVAA